MTEQQQKLYDKLLKKVNEYCLGAAAEDVIAAIDALVDTYETPKVDSIIKNEYYLGTEKVSQQVYETIQMYKEMNLDLIEEKVKYKKALEIIKQKCSLDEYKGGYYFNGERISQEQYELLKEVRQ